MSATHKISFYFVLLVTGLPVLHSNTYTKDIFYDSGLYGCHEHKKNVERWLISYPSKHSMHKCSFPCNCVLCWILHLQTSLFLYVEQENETHKVQLSKIKFMGDSYLLCWFSLSTGKRDNKRKPHTSRKKTGLWRDSRSNRHASKESWWLSLCYWSSPNCNVQFKHKVAKHHNLFTSNFHYE